MLLLFEVQTRFSASDPAWAPRRHDPVDHYEAIYVFWSYKIDVKTIKDWIRHHLGYQAHASESD